MLLTANGLSNYSGETALVQKIFLSDPSQSNSLVNQLGNPTWLSTVQTYNFAKNGLKELQNPTVVSTLANAYAEVEWRQGLDQATPGLANALTFLSQASSITSADDVLSNDTNFQVITTALGIPQDIVFQDQSAQENAITSHLNISQLQNRNYVTSLTDQYLLAMQERTVQPRPRHGPLGHCGANQRAGRVTAAPGRRCRSRHPQSWRCGLGRGQRRNESGRLTYRNKIAPARFAVADTRPCRTATADSPPWHRHAAPCGSHGCAAGWRWPHCSLVASARRPPTRTTWWGPIPVGRHVVVSARKL